MPIRGSGPNRYGRAGAIWLQARVPGARDMSTPEARLHQMVGQFAQRRRGTADSPVQTAQREADERCAQRVRGAAEAYYARTQALIAATGKPIHHAVHNARTGHGFALDVGRWPAVQVDLVADDWHVALRNRLMNVFRVTFTTDAALLNAKDEILETLVANALAALERGSESPADGRGRQKTTFPSLTRKTPRRAAAVPVPLRPVMLAVYAVAFAAGFVVSPLLFVRPTAPPSPAARQGGAVHRPSTVAVAYRVPRSTHPTRPSITAAAALSRSRALFITASAAPAKSVPATTISDPANKSSASVGAHAMTENARGAIAQTSRFHVQVGVFTTPDDARQVVRRLESLGYAAALADRAEYPVWVGAYLEQDTAERLAADVRKAGFNAVLVP